jgi:epoxyqueuosine reductase
MATSDDLTAAKEAIRREALALGFAALGVAAPGADPARAGALAAYLSAGAHGDMEWMARTPERRSDPNALLPNLGAVIAVAFNYGPASDPLAERPAGEGRISVYAQGDDYHDVLKARLVRLAQFIARNYGGEIRVFVDTAPVMEKPLAARARLGWQGKHTNLVSRDYGSWLFLGEIFTTLALPPDPPEVDHCGNCRRCLDACPTGALPAPYQIEPRRCISYLTIEHKGHIARELRPKIGNRIYGCDECLAVCPWNKYAVPTNEAAFLPRPEFTAPMLAELATLGDAGFRKLFRKSPVKRIGRDRFLRNVLIALGNSGHAELAPSARAHLDDPSPLVRAMAVWALAQLLDPATFAALRDVHAARETDDDVRAEWNAEASRSGARD